MLCFRLVRLWSATPVMHTGPHTDPSPSLPFGKSSLFLDYDLDPSVNGLFPPALTAQPKCLQKELEIDQERRGSSLNRTASALSWLLPPSFRGQAENGTWLLFAKMNCPGNCSFTLCFPPPQHEDLERKISGSTKSFWKLRAQGRWRSFCQGGSPLY